MTKINEIQSALKGLSGGAFQKLANAYLHKKGYEQISIIGSVVGADKTKPGTPDTLIPLPTGRYVFAEHTTQQGGLFDKLAGDLEKCFDEKKVGVPIEEIEEVIFCHTSTLEPKERHDLAERCQQRGVNLNVFDIGTISYDLYQKYPGLAKDFLGIEVDTGQIVSTGDFVVGFGKNRLATPLDTAFHFREQEVEQVLHGLEESDLVIISGRPGVGKSRLALECCEQFSRSHSDYQVWCVLDQGLDLYEDLRVYLSDSGFYLVLVDDANRVSRFEYVVQLLQSQREDQRFKVIATVRDYARDKVRETALPHGGWIEVEIQPMEEQQIRKLVKDEYGILNPLYLERIAEIAGGNPRLAIMAAGLAKQEDTLHSISDVSALYDEYFASIRRDLADLHDRDLLKAAGIVTFFRFVDRSNDKMMRAIQEAFGISADGLWQAARRLHDLELLDMYEDEVVRASDQVLATYLFYLAFFKEQVLDFSALLHAFFPSLRHRLADALYPALSAFHAGAITEALRPHVDKAWEAYLETSDLQTLFELMEVFWFVKETDTLLQIRDLIEAAEPDAEVDVSALEFRAESDMSSPSLLTVLSRFKYASIDSLRMALDLLLTYVSKRPADLGKVLYLLKDHFGFEHDSYMRGFGVQRAVIDVLWEHAKDGSDELLSKLFLAIAEPYLHTRFDTTMVKQNRSFVVVNFELFLTPELSVLRQTIWDQLFRLHRVPVLQQDVLNIVKRYCRDGYSVSVGEILAQDVHSVLPFINSELDPDSYRDCTTINAYLDTLERHKVDFDGGLRTRFTSATYMVSRLLLGDYVRRRVRNLKYEEYQELKWTRIEEHLQGHKPKAYEQFFQRCLSINAELDTNHEICLLQEAVEVVLWRLASRDPESYIAVLEHYLGLGDPLRLHPIRLVTQLIRILGSESTAKVIELPDYSTKCLWLLCYYHALPTENVLPEHVDHIYTLYRKAGRSELLPGFDYLLKYLDLDGRILAKVTQILLERVDEDSGFVTALKALFYQGSQVNTQLAKLFSVDFSLLKRAYFVVSQTDVSADYNAVTFNRLLDHDPDILEEYIDRMYAKAERLPRYDDTRDYSIFWMRDDYVQVMARVVAAINEHEQGWRVRGGTYLGTFFGLEQNRWPDIVVQQRQDHFLIELIAQQHDRLDLMGLIFGVASHFPPERRRPLLDQFLKYNSSFDDFLRLPLLPAAFDFSLPGLQGRKDYLESLHPSLSTVDLLQHRQHLERQIQTIQQQMEQVKKSNFIGDY